MKIFDKPNGHVNFVDDNNVFVGYDLGEQCCENAGWFLSWQKPNGLPENIEAISVASSEAEEYNFDPKFFEQFCPGDTSCDVGEMAVFRLTKPSAREMFLTIYNCHNGYYNHGFMMHEAQIWDQDVQILQSGYL